MAFEVEFAKSFLPLVTKRSRFQEARIFLSHEIVRRRNQSSWFSFSQRVKTFSHRILNSANAPIVKTKRSASTDTQRSFYLQNFCRMHVYTIFSCLDPFYCESLPEILTYSIRDRGFGEIIEIPAEPP